MYTHFLRIHSYMYSLKKDIENMISSLLSSTEYVGVRVNLRAELGTGTLLADEVPEWIHEHPVPA